MATCARCGADGAGAPTLNRHVEYEYCDECNDQFESAAENGVVVRSRHSNRDFDRLPYVVEITVDGIPNPHSQSTESTVKPESQAEALAMATELMQQHEVPGVFIYQKTGAVWLIDEYLDSHPGIARDVEDERGSGLIQKLAEFFGGPSRLS